MKIKFLYVQKVPKCDVLHGPSFFKANKSLASTFHDKITRLSFQRRRKTWVYVERRKPYDLNVMVASLCSAGGSRVNRCRPGQVVYDCYGRQCTAHACIAVHSVSSRW